MQKERRLSLIHISGIRPDESGFCKSGIRLYGYRSSGKRDCTGKGRKPVSYTHLIVFPLEESLLRKKTHRYRVNVLKSCRMHWTSFWRTIRKSKKLKAAPIMTLPGDGRKNRWKNITRERIRLFAICRKKKGQIMQTLRKKKSRQINAGTDH